jgi:hypothetical protein
MNTQQNEPMPLWCQNLLMVNSHLDESSIFHSDPPGAYRVPPPAHSGPPVTGPGLFATATPVQPIPPSAAPPPVVRQWTTPRAAPTINAHLFKQ